MPPHLSGPGTPLPSHITPQQLADFPHHTTMPPATACMRVVLAQQPRMDWDMVGLSLKALLLPFLNSTHLLLKTSELLGLGQVDHMDCRDRMQDRRIMAK
ncbi:hypothetical protein CsSME_00049184 [Camellia sinensis var. sinensis]